MSCPGHDQGKTPARGDGYLSVVHTLHDDPPASTRGRTITASTSVEATLSRFTREPTAPALAGRSNSLSGSARTHHILLAARDLARRFTKELIRVQNHRCAPIAGNRLETNTSHQGRNKTLSGSLGNRQSRPDPRWSRQLAHTTSQEVDRRGPFRPRHASKIPSGIDRPSPWSVMATLSRGPPWTQFKFVALPLGGTAIQRTHVSPDLSVCPDTVSGRPTT